MFKLVFTKLKVCTLIKDISGQQIEHPGEKGLADSLTNE